MWLVALIAELKGTGLSAPTAAKGTQLGKVGSGGKKFDFYPAVLEATFKRLDNRGRDGRSCRAKKNGPRTEK